MFQNRRHLYVKLEVLKKNQKIAMFLIFSICAVTCLIFSLQIPNQFETNKIDLQFCQNDTQIQELDKISINCLVCYDINNQKGISLYSTFNLMDSNILNKAQYPDVILTNYTQLVTLEQANCKEILNYTNAQILPDVDKDLPSTWIKQPFRQYSKNQRQQSSLNNLEHVQINCYEIPATDDMSCKMSQLMNHVLQEQFQQIAFLFKFYTQDYTSSIQDMNFYATLENMEFQNQINWYNKAFLFVTTYFLIFYISRVISQFRYVYWHQIHFWILYLLIALFLFNNPFIFFENIMNETIYILLKIYSETILYIILFYFWMKLFEDGVDQCYRQRPLKLWPVKYILSILLIMIILFSKSTLNFLKEKAPITKSFDNTIYYKRIYDLFMLFLTIYTFFFLNLCWQIYSLFYLSSQDDQTDEKEYITFYKSACHWSTFIYFVLVFMIAFSYFTYFEIQALFQLGITSILNLYIFFMTILYAPQLKSDYEVLDDLKNSNDDIRQLDADLDQKQKKIRITQQKEEMKIIKSIEEREIKKKKSWGQIAEICGETPQNQKHLIQDKKIKEIPNKIKELINNRTFDPNVDQSFSLSDYISKK